MPITKYPFNKMELGATEQLTFEAKSQAVKARIAAHAFGCYSDRRFRTSITGTTLEVRRVL